MSVGGQLVKSYGYDAAGRATSVVSPAGTTTLMYDFEGRVTSIVGPGISQTNVFNGLDTRVDSTTDSVTRTFLRDGAYVTDPVLRDGAVIYTPDTSKRRRAATTYLHSGLKNADAHSGSAQNLTASRAYDAFGNVLSSSGSWQGPFGYAGAYGYQKDATGLMLLGHRLYDPSTGRILTRDPIKDGRNWYVWNWYVYCEGAPGPDPDSRFIIKPPRITKPSRCGRIPGRGAGTIGTIAVAAYVLPQGIEQVINHRDRKQDYLDATVQPTVENQIIKWEGVEPGS